MNYTPKTNVASVRECVTTASSEKATRSTDKQIHIFPGLSLISRVSSVSVYRNTP